MGNGALLHRVCRPHGGMGFATGAPSRVAVRARRFADRVMNSKFYPQAAERRPAARRGQKTGNITLMTTAPPPIATP